MRYLAALALVLAAAGCGWWSVPVRTSLGPPGATRQSAGACAFEMPAHLSAGGPAMLSTELPDGALILGTWRLKSSTIAVSLTRMNPDCQSYRLAPIRVRVRKFGTIDSLVATPQADLLLAGSDGRDAIVGRFFATGRPDRSFGQGGWVRLRPHERPQGAAPPFVFEATSIAVARSGTIVVGGNDGGPHCCTRDFVSEISPDGRGVRTVFPPGFGGSYTTNVYPVDGSVYVLGEYEQSGCGGPSVVRIRRDGTLDATFDATMRRTLGRITTQASHLRFTPTLVPEGTRGAFLLVGGLDRTCVAAQSGSLGSGGVALAVNASGQLSRRPTRFASPNFAFDSPVTVWLRSGEVYAAGVAYTTNGRWVKGIFVQTLGPGGSLAGRHVFHPPAKHRASFAAVALLPGPRNDVWIVVGVKREIVGRTFG